MSKEEGQLSGRANVKFEGTKSATLPFVAAHLEAIVVFWASSELEVIPDGSPRKQLKTGRNYSPLKLI